jgi:large subunit ribosomal protein L15
MTGGPLPLWRRLPQRGFTNALFRKRYGIVNVGDLQRFAEGTLVTPEVLKEHGVVKQAGAEGVKVLGSGEITTALTVRAHAFSGSAVAKIETAGGKAEVIPGPRPPVRRKMGAGARRRAEHGPEVHEG